MDSEDDDVAHTQKCGNQHTKKKRFNFCESVIGRNVKWARGTKDAACQPPGNTIGEKVSK